MKLRKSLLFVTLIGTLALLMPATLVMAGAGPEPPQGATILPTQIWGVVTLYCTPAANDLVVVRAKRIVDCDVQTELLVDTNWGFGCPAQDDENAPLDWALEGHQLFALPGTPYITKVKNFRQEINSDTGTNVTSFEAQFGFFQ